MGQKVNPKSIRLVLKKNWQSQWFSRDELGKLSVEDYQIRKIVSDNLKNAGIDKIEIKRDQQAIHVNIHSARPGIIIGRGGRGVALIRDLLAKKFPGRKFNLDIIEIKNPELSAKVMAENIAYQISKRISYRRAAKQAIDKIIAVGASGVQIKLAGRLGGAEIARSEKFSKGSLPLATFRSNVDYAQVHAFTTYGVVGVKVWIHRKSGE